MAIGEKIASCSFVEALLNLVTKDKHKLREGDLNLNDKMKYGAVERLCSPHVAKLLSTFVPGIYTIFNAKLFSNSICHFKLYDGFSGAEATSFYLKLMHLIASSFLDKSLPPLDRIYRIWFSTFALRIWWFWLCSEENYTLENNFISSNAYLCV